MCVVSMVSDHYKRMWPSPLEWQQVNNPDYSNYQELLRKARLYDELTKQQDCPAPDKVEWQEKIDKYMKDKFGLVPK